MTEYTKLVAAVRDTDFGDTCVYCEHSDMCKDADCIILQAADAIEALRADMKTYGKTAFDEGYAMGFAAGEDRAEKQMPKRGVKKNADIIRAMTDEELAEWVTSEGRYFGEEYEGYMSCLDWLKEEVQDD